MVVLSLSHTSHIRTLANPWTAACQAPLSMGFPKQKYWSGLPFPSPGDLPDLEIELTSPALQMDSLLLSHQGSLKFILELCICFLFLMNEKILNYVALCSFPIFHAGDFTIDFIWSIIKC